MSEKDFQAEIGRSIKETNIGLYHKIADVPVSQFGEKARNWSGGQKPFDCFWALPGAMFLAMELKQQRGLSLNIGEKGHLRQHQEEALTHLNGLGFPALVVVNFQHIFPAARAKKLGLTKIDRAFAVRANRLVEARSHLCSDTIPLDWWEKWAVELTPCTVGNQRGWRVETLIERFAS